MKIDNNNPPAWYCEYSDLPLVDQEYIYNLPVFSNNNTNTAIKERDNVSVNGNDNGTCKLGVNSELFKGKRGVVLELTKCRYNTSPLVIANILQRLFTDEVTKDGHWLYIAQNWTPRAINRVIAYMMRVHIRGEHTIRSKAGYFTFLVKKRKRRKSHRDQTSTQ